MNKLQKELDDLRKERKEREENNRLQLLINKEIEMKNKANKGFTGKLIDKVMHYFKE